MHPKDLYTKALNITHNPEKNLDVIILNVVFF